MNLFEKMAAITAELGTVAKNMTVDTGKNKSYKAVSERDVLDAVKPLEAKYKVYSYPVSRETVESERLESESTYNGNTTKKTTFYTRLKTVYRFVNAEKPEEYIETTVFSIGIDSQDKGDGKAMTYGDKYALMKAYKISTGDDPDQNASVDTDYRKDKAAEKKQDQKAYSCSDCGGEIKPFTKKDGSVMTVQDIVALGMKDFGTPLCKNCYTARFNESKNR